MDQSEQSDARLRPSRLPCRRTISPCRREPAGAPPTRTPCLPREHPSHKWLCRSPALGGHSLLPLFRYIARRCFVLVSILFFSAQVILPLRSRVPPNPLRGFFG